MRVLASTWLPRNGTWPRPVASHLVKTEPMRSGASRALKVQKRSCSGPVFNLACYASVAGRFEEAKERLKRAVELDKQFQKVRYR
jgi:hypothetical protein